MSTDRNRRFNPLVLDPDNYDRLFDEDFLTDDDILGNRDEYEPISQGVRRRKPVFESDS